MDLQTLTAGRTNFVFLGEAGCGKSEAALNLAYALLARGDGPVHFFDLDMTKPLFRSRDLAGRLSADGIHVHFQQQFMDAPTTAGGVRALLRDPHAYVVMDVGGDYIGARAIGGYAPLLTPDTTGIFYLINPFRVWSGNVNHIDGVLAQVLAVSHIPLDHIQLIGNANLGVSNTPAEVVEGSRRLAQMVAPYKPITAYCVWEKLYPAVAQKLDAPVWPIRLYLHYPWVNNAAS